MNSASATIDPTTTTTTPTNESYHSRNDSSSNDGSSNGRKGCLVSAPGLTVGSSASSASSALPTESTTMSKCKKSLLIASLIFLLAMSIAFVQAVLHLLMFRKYFASAPIPKSPSHGVIVAHSCPHENGDQVCSAIKGGSGYLYYDTDHDTDDISGVDAATNYTFKAYNPFIKSTQEDVEQQLQSQSHAQQEQSQAGPPLRLLLIGDSIARGVGQAHHCNPVLPQAMGKYLSQNLNGRAVYWTTMAEPGASTKLLSDLVEEEQYKQKRREKRRSRHGGNGTAAAPNSSDNEPMYSLTQFRDRHLSATGSRTVYNKKRWIENLEYHKELYSQNPFGDYDIIIVMSGLNDIKRMLMPFLLEDETIDRDGEDPDADGVQDRDNNDQYSKERGFAADMKRLIQLLSMKQSRDYMNNDSACSTDESGEAVCSPLLSSSKQQLEQQRRQELPTIVFPQFPSNRNPVIMAVMVKTIIIKMSILMELVKGRIADQYDNVISPLAPTLEFSMAYLLQRSLKTSIPAEGDDDASGLVDDQDVMVNLIDMAKDNCKMMEDNMSKFYSQRNAKDFCYESPLQKLYAPDGFHPSDFGYDMFGQLLAKEVLKQWDHNR